MITIADAYGLGRMKKPARLGRKSHYNHSKNGEADSMKGNLHVVEKYFFKLSRIILKISSSNCSDIFLENPICIYKEFIISFFVKLILINQSILCLILSIKFPDTIFTHNSRELVKPI